MSENNDQANEGSYSERSLDLGKWGGVTVRVPKIPKEIDAHHKLAFGLLCVLASAVVAAVYALKSIAPLWFLAIPLSFFTFWLLKQGFAHQNQAETRESSTEPRPDSASESPA